MSSLEAKLRELEERVHRLEDRAAIQDLRFRYHVAVNEKALDSIPELFTEDAEVHFEGIGAASGQSEISALYAEVVGQSPFIKQFIHNHVITLGIHLTGTSRLQDWQEALAGHIPGDSYAGRFQECWGKIRKADKIVHRPARFDLTAPPNGKGHVYAKFITGGLASREGHSIVTRDHNESII
mgnify:CR=1 FL=1